MKLNALLSLTLLALCALPAGAAATDPEDAGTSKKVIVALKTDDVELHELDISHLQPGDAETIFTEDGKTIDVLRTEDDVEIYIDGELLEVGGAGVGHHGVVHAVHRNIETNCDDDTDCNELVLLGDGEAFDPAELHDGKKVVIIRKEFINK